MYMKCLFTFGRQCAERVDASFRYRVVGVDE